MYHLKVDAASVVLRISIGVYPVEPHLIYVEKAGSVTVTNKYFTDRGFSYAPDTGILYCSLPRGVGGRLAPGPVTGRSKEGYMRVVIEGKEYRQHRIAFLLMGIDPCGKEVDHINGIKDDNRWENLRLVTTQQNQWNQHCHRAGKLPGVDLHKQGWRARFRGKHLGYFKTQQEAHECFVKAKRRKTEESL